MRPIQFVAMFFLLFHCPYPPLRIGSCAHTDRAQSLPDSHGTGYCPASVIADHRERLRTYTYADSAFQTSGPPATTNRSRNFIRLIKNAERLSYIRSKDTQFRVISLLPSADKARTGYCTGPGDNTLRDRKTGRRNVRPVNGEASPKAHLVLHVYSNRLMILSMMPKRIVSSASFSTRVPPASVCALKATRPPASSALMKAAR